MTSRVRKTGDARNSFSGDSGVASLCFGCPETSCHPLPESQGAASRWSIQYSRDGEHTSSKEGSPAQVRNEIVIRLFAQIVVKW